MGYFSYDTVRYVERKKLLFSSAPEDDRNLPDVHLGLYDDVIVFDHVEKVSYLNSMMSCVRVFSGFKLIQIQVLTSLVKF